MTTPAGRPLAVPTAALAGAIVQEWQDIKGVPGRGQIPLTQYANTAIDHIAAAPEAAIAGYLSHAQSDLLCYRADQPPELATLQAGRWQPWLDWAKAGTGAEFAVFSGLMPRKQNPAAISALREAVSGCDEFALLALAQAAGLTGSAVLALALLRKELDHGEALDLSLLDETFQAERWGEPDELKARRADLQRELAELERFIQMLN